MNFEEIVAEVKKELKNEPLGSSSTYYPLICEGETGWSILVLRPKTKNQVVYILSQATLYGLQGNAVLYRLKNGYLKKCDDNYGWGWDGEYYIRFRGRQINCEVIHRCSESSWQRSYK